MKYSFHNQQGYIALMSVILISATLLVLTFALGTAGFYSRFNVLDFENKKVSIFLAESCATTAMVHVAQDSSAYPGSIPASGEQVSVGTGKTCRICSVAGSNPYTIVTRSVYNNAYTNLTVTGTLGASNFIVNSWDEQASYAGSCSVP